MRLDNFIQTAMNNVLKNPVLSVLRDINFSSILKQSNFIKRDISKEDKRKSSVTLTQNGVFLIESCICETSKRLENHFKVLSQKEQNDLKKILSKLIYSMI